MKRKMSQSRVKPEPMCLPVKHLTIMIRLADIAVFSLWYQCKKGGTGKICSTLFNLYCFGFFPLKRSIFYQVYLWYLHSHLTICHMTTFCLYTLSKMSTSVLKQYKRKVMQNMLSSIMFFYNIDSCVNSKSMKSLWMYRTCNAVKVCGFSLALFSVLLSDWFLLWLWKSI